jgi:dihydrofolate reductase
MTLIAARNRDYGIGRKNDLLCRIPEDMRFFKERTSGKAIITGHSTFKSFKDGKPLADRLNIVLSRDVSLKIDGALVCHSLNGLFSLLKARGVNVAFVIGGQSVYELLADYCGEALITEIDDEAEADAFLAGVAPPRWRLETRSDTRNYNGLKYSFCRYINTEIKVPPV